MEIADPISAVISNKNSDIWTVEPDCMVFDAIQKMSEKKVGALPVMTGAKLLGIVSERDYTRKVILAGKSSKTTPVKDIMSDNVHTISPGDSVAQSMEMMTELRVRHLPVIERGKVVGIVTIGDLVKWTISAQGALIEHLEGYIHGSYPG